MSYQDTDLWKRTLGSEHEKAQYLRESFLDARENAEYLLGKIRDDFPQLTVHDITHVDSLWDVADTIIGPDYPINPLEGYILGISFLIHDAALSYETVGGIDKLRETVEWKDAYADGTNGKNEEEFKKECDFTAIRALHARKAENILLEKFSRQNGEVFFIIGDDDIRDHFWELIGKIAASHHWDIDDIASKLKKQINPRSGFPKDWKINVQKLACILRCADSGHIDNGRAPDHIYKILEINGVSKQHWDSQNHLCQVCEDVEDESKLCITSINPFPKKEFAAWNVAYDAIKVFDNEIKASNELLKEQGLDFPHRGVSGATSKEALSKYIETKDWEPCSFDVHASNVKALIVNLGGQQLYGDEIPHFVILRELIQNARDAIIARKCIEDTFQDGRIYVHIQSKPGTSNSFIEISDNGIGMSKSCIKGHLLNFGSSYWLSSLSKQENPGLRSSGFSSVGKYGIGFYSVFMVAKSVQVYTRRYNTGTDQTIKIDFPQGLTLSPILSKSQSASHISTSIHLELNHLFPEIKIKGYTLASSLLHRKVISLTDILRIITAGLDANVYFKQDDSDYICIHTDITSSSFDKRQWLNGLNIDHIKNIDKYADRLETIKDSSGRIRGLVAIPYEECFDKFYPSILSVGGLTCSLNKSYNNKFIGYLDLKENNLSRNGIFFDKELRRILRKWTEHQYSKNYEKIVESSILAHVFQELIAKTSENSISHKLMDFNKFKFYSHYLHGDLKIEIGTMKGLREIHRRLFVGIITQPGELIFNAGKSQSLSDVNDVDLMPDDSFESIIFKYIQVSNFGITSVGKKISTQIWTDLMLHRLMGKMIDWRSIFKDENETEKFNRAYKKRTKEKSQLCDYLRKFLKPAEDIYGKRL